jgi:hypothetical protein
MKRIGQILLMLFFITSICAQKPSNTVNPLIGDESFVALFGFQPDQHTDNQLRVQTHLSYAEYILRDRSVEGLSEQQKKNREMVLDHLRDYWTKGVFPANLDYPDERKPCFIDKNGNICAVGYLIEKTAGIEVARQINEKHQYDNLMDMHSPVIAAWAEEHGFTLEECATIQPTYGPPPPDVITNVPIKKGYGISSGLVGGFNLAVNTVNISGRFGNVKAVSFLGFVSGATQIILGVSNIKKDVNQYSGWNMGREIESYKAQNNLSYVNIAVGTTTLVTSALNLFINNKIKDKKSTVGLYSYQGLNNEMNLGLSFARKL